MSNSLLNSGLGLAETIDYIGSKEAVVAIDCANVQAWEKPVENRGVMHFSLGQLAAYLKKIESVKKRYLFTSRYSFNNKFIQKVIHLIEDIEPGALRRAQVNDRQGEIFEFEGRIYDLELLMIVANDLINSGKINEIKEQIAQEVHNISNQVLSNKKLWVRERQGYEVITTDYRVYKNSIAKMEIIGSLAKEADIDEAEEVKTVPVEKGVTALKDNLELAEIKLSELLSKNVELEGHKYLIERIKDIATQVRLLEGELERKDHDIAMLEKNGERQRDKVREIMEIANKAASTLVSKGNVDSFLVASMMDRKVMDNADAFVVFSGDGDFRLMYEKMLEAKKQVVVVSPWSNLNGSLKRMIANGQISLVSPENEKVLWEKSRSNYPKPVR
jgi:uncharacterized LabA/DUF88 family protein